MKFCRYGSQILQEMTNFCDYPRDFRPLSGHWEIWSKIWSLLDCSRELTALGIPSWSPVHLFTHASNGDVFGYFPLASGACPNITLKIFLILYFMLNLVANLESLGSLTLIWILRWNVIVQVKGEVGRTVDGDWCFTILSGSHLQSQVMFGNSNECSGFLICIVALWLVVGRVMWLVVSMVIGGFLWGW